MINPYEEADVAQFRARAAGMSRNFPAAVALRLIGKRDEVHPRDAAAFVWRDEELANFACEANRVHFGHRVWGPIMTDGGMLEVIDLRPAMGDTDSALLTPPFPTPRPSV